MVYMVKNEILYKGNVVAYRIVDGDGVESDVSGYFLSYLVRDGFVTNARLITNPQVRIVPIAGNFEKITWRDSRLPIPKSELLQGIEVAVHTDGDIEVGNKYGSLYSWQIDDGYHIETISVKYRGHGLGTALYQRFEAFVRAHNLGNHIEAEAVGPVLIRFWRKQGFTDIDYVTMDGYVSGDPEYPEAALAHKFLA